LDLRISPVAVLVSVIVALDALTVMVFDALDMVLLVKVCVAAIVSIISEVVTGNVKVLAAVCAPPDIVDEKVLAGFLRSRSVSVNVLAPVIVWVPFKRLTLAESAESGMLVKVFEAPDMLLFVRVSVFVADLYNDQAPLLLMKISLVSVS
jgi:hypothetical protein